MSEESILIIYLIIMTSISLILKEFNDVQEGILFINRYFMGYTNGRRVIFYE